LNLAAPLLDEDGGKLFPVGVVILQIDPNDFINPLLASWPTPSRSAETMLIRREGDEIVGLNSRGSGGGRVLRMSAHDMPLISSFANRIEEGVFAGTDYRGVSVLAATKVITALLGML
jgi:hypothetical protein